MIRPLTADDFSDIPRLLATDRGEHAQPSDELRAVVQGLLPQLLIHTPHADPDIQGLVSEEADGRLSGMIGRIARRMEFRDRPIRVGVTFELFVDPAHRAKMLGVKLLKAAMAGPQDLLISDIANDKSRKIWTGLGGSVASWYGLTWAKVLQPAQFGWAMLPQRSLGKLAWLARPLARLVDCASRRFGLFVGQPLTPQADAEPLTPEAFLELFPQFSSPDELRPVYDRETIDWLWPRLDFLYAAGPSEQILVKSPGGEPLGWYVYQMTDARIARVSQLVGHSKTLGSVLDHLVHRAAQRGAIAVTGRVLPRQLQTFIDRNCLIHRRSTFTLIHARDPELLQAFETGRAFLSLFDGEGPVQVWNHPQIALQRLRRAADRGAVPAPPVTVEPKQPNLSESEALVRKD